MYANGRGVEKDDVQAVEWYRKAAEQGHANAQCNLGVMYEDGRGVKKDDVQAVECYCKAAEQGLAVAQINLGWMYANGFGVEKNEVQTAECYCKAAEQGYANAQSNLGVMYEDGRGVKKDEEQAVAWYREFAAALQELAAALKRYRDLEELLYATEQHKLGLMYANGFGVEKNEVQAAECYRKAVECYRKAAEQGNATARRRLGDCYENEKGV